MKKGEGVYPLPCHVETQLPPNGAQLSFFFFRGLALGFASLVGFERSTEGFGFAEALGLEALGDGDGRERSTRGADGRGFVTRGFVGVTRGCDALGCVGLGLAALGLVTRGVP